MASLSFWILSWTVRPEAALLESVGARPGYSLCLSTHSNAVACSLAWSCCWGCCVYQAFRGSGQHILCIVGNVEQKARHNLVQAALIALPELIRSGSGGELSPVLCSV